MTDRKSLLLDILREALAEVHPKTCLPPALAVYDAPPKGRTIIIGAGKAAAQMATAFEEAYPYPLEGTVVTREGFGCATRTIDVIEADHPVPTARSVTAAARLIDLVRDCRRHDRVVFLLSGGASSLLVRPAPGVTLAEKGYVTRRLLAAGATISEMNTVRAALSGVKGGRLAALCPAPIDTFAISDVVGDAPHLIGSGPTVPSSTTASDAIAVLDRYQLATDRLRDAVEGNAPPRAIEGGRYVMLASATELMKATVAAAAQRGLAADVIATNLEGEAVGVAKAHAERAGRTSGPSLLISGGELTTILSDEPGVGGPNHDYTLSLANAFRSTGRRFAALAFDTDGIDGNAPSGGGYVDETTLTRGEQYELGAVRSLTTNDAYTYLATVGDAVALGPTGTNVNDLRMILVD